MPEARPPWGDPPAHCRAGASRWGRICGFALPGASECERLPRLADGCMSDRATIRIAARFEEDAWRQSKAPIFRGWAHPAGFRPNWGGQGRSEEHTSELQSLMRISYAVFCLKKKNKKAL